MRRSRSKPRCAKSPGTWPISSRKSGELKGVVDYAEMFASMAGEFVDLRDAGPLPCLDPDPTIGYPAGNALADSAFARGLNGIIYPSVRHAGGTCLAALRPHAVQSVAPGGSLPV